MMKIYYSHMHNTHLSISMIYHNIVCCICFTVYWVKIRCQSQFLSHVVYYKRDHSNSFDKQCIYFTFFSERNPNCGHVGICSAAVWQRWSHTKYHILLYHVLDTLESICHLEDNLWCCSCPVFTGDCRTEENHIKMSQIKCTIWGKWQKKNNQNRCDWESVSPARWTDRILSSFVLGFYSSLTWNVMVEWITEASWENISITSFCSAPQHLLRFISPFWMSHQCSCTPIIKHQRMLSLHKCNKQPLYRIVVCNLPVSQITTKNNQTYFFNIIFTSFVNTESVMGRISWNETECG